MIPGTKVTLGDRDFVIPPITLGMLRGGLLADVKASDELADKGDNFGAMDKRADVILAAFRRNYTAEEVSDANLLNRLDMANFGAAWMAALGLTRGAAVAAIEDGTSTVFTPPSPPPTDGMTGSSTS